MGPGTFAGEARRAPGGTEPEGTPPGRREPAGLVARQTPEPTATAAPFEAAVEDTAARGLRGARAPRHYPPRVVAERLSIAHVTPYPWEQRHEVNRFVARLADAGEEALQRLAELPGGQKALTAYNDLRTRVDDLGIGGAHGPIVRASQGRTASTGRS